MFQHPTIVQDRLLFQPSHQVLLNACTTFHRFQTTSVHTLNCTDWNQKIVEVLLLNKDRCQFQRMEENPLRFQVYQYLSNFDIKLVTHAKLLFPILYIAFACTPYI